MTGLENAAESADRKAELAGNLAGVEERVRAACSASGRAREDVTLIVVTKTYPAEDVRLLAELDVRQVAENRDQEAAPKAEACADLALDWHFVGQMQTNKARSVAGYASHVHSVDRSRLVRALSVGAERSGREIGVLIQVALDAESGAVGSRGGAAPGDVERLADEVAVAQGLRLDGVMTVAPLAGAYAGRPQQAFEQLREISSRLRVTHPAAKMVSAGMSSDLEQAIAAGTTHIRVGSAVLGDRPRLR